MLTGIVTTEMSDIVTETTKIGIVGVITIGD